MNSNGTPSPSMALRLRSPATTPSASGGRDDCWSEDATFTLIEAWGDRYLECNRGNLRQKHWQEVADTVNDRHHKNQPTRRRTDVQCKNRIDTLKKKYKVEKARFNDSGGNYVSPWPFFSSLDALIGTTFPAAKKPSPSPSPPRLLTFSTPVPVARRSATVKRPAPVSMWLPETASGSPYHRKFSAFAAAAAAAAEAEEAAAAARESEEERVSSEGSGGSSYRSTRSDKKRKRRGSGDGGPGGFRELAEAVERFAEIYERVEGAKQKQMIELEKQRMQFAKDLEFQRMQFIMETQIQLQKLKRANDSSANGNY